MATRTLNRTIETRFPDLVLIGCVLGFAFLLVELYLFDHYRQGTQIVGFAATAVGLVLSLLAFVRSRAVRGVVMVLLGLLTLSGVFGLVQHNEARAEDAARFAQRQQQQGASGQGTGGQAATGQQPSGQNSAASQGGPDGPGGTGPRVFRSNIPVLSPLSLSALAGLTLLTMVARGGEARNRLT